MEKECVGCSEVGVHEHCDGNMCHDCWLKETRDEENNKN